MLSPTPCPPEFRAVVEDPESGLIISGGRYHVVDGRDFKAGPGRIVATTGQVFIRGGDVLVEGPLTVLAAHPARVTLRKALGKSLGGARFILLAGSRAILMGTASFEARDDATVELHAGGATGVARDRARIVLHQDYDGDFPHDVIIHGRRVLVEDLRASSSGNWVPVVSHLRAPQSGPQRNI